jgi:hypothetical protein
MSSQSEGEAMTRRCDMTEDERKEHDANTAYEWRKEAGEAHKAYMRNYMREYRAKNVEKLRAYRNEWRKKKRAAEKAAEQNGQQLPS